METEKERLVNKEVMPTEDSINHFLGAESVNRLSHFEKMLRENYDLNCELIFPFGKEYGWAYYSVSNDEELKDIISLVGCKVKPK